MVLEYFIPHRRSPSPLQSQGAARHDASLQPAALPAAVPTSLEVTQLPLSKGWALTTVFKVLCGGRSPSWSRHSCGPRAVQQPHGQGDTDWCRRPKFNPRVGKIPWRRNGNPLQYSCLENPMDGGAWRATVRRAANSQDTTE